ncbi:MAG: lysophospholipid acyltransferase family protein [Bacteroidota bacterium]
MLLRQLYSIWVIFSMTIFFSLCIFPLLICSPFKRFHIIALWINRLWALGFFKLAFIPVRYKWEFDPEKNKQYILCANHFSFMDIPALGLFPKPFKFVGKSQLARIPLFGLMYNKIHITVNRSSYRSRANSLIQARKELEYGYNLGFFPEGGIRIKRFPEMENFHDGAFRLSVETNTPIVPISFPDNYQILPDDKILKIRRKPCRIIYHRPIYPQGRGEGKIKQLRYEVFRVIQSSLRREQNQ